MVEHDADDPPPYLEELADCVLCEHRCGANRLAGELGVCGVTTPAIASARLHPAPPESYTMFVPGCNYRCLGCQNWTISGHPHNGTRIRGFVPPALLAREAVAHLGSLAGRLMGADRLFFSGGEATIHLPYIEEVVREARKLDPTVRVNFDTNGFLTEASLRRVLSFATSITFDIKAYHDDTHRALTGCPVEPVLRNAALIARGHAAQLWEFRVLVVPGLNEDDMPPLCEHLAALDPELPVAFLAFRPNHVLESHPGASRTLMNRCVDVARAAGLRNAHWSGAPGIPGTMLADGPAPGDGTVHAGAARAMGYAHREGCQSLPRDCGECSLSSGPDCPIKPYVPSRAT